MAVADGTQVSSAWWGGAQKTVGTTFGEWEDVTVGGVRYAGPHTGLDIPMDSGTSLVNPVHAVVDSAGTDAVGNNFVKLRLDNGLYVVLLHLSDIAVQAGQDLSPGTLLGHSGNSGLSTGPHLHFEVDQGATPIDPWNILNMSTQSGGQSAQGASLGPFDLSGLVKPLQGISDALSTEQKIFKFLTTKQNWYRGMFVATGLGLIGLGVFIYFFKEESTIVIQTAKTGAEAGALAA